MTESYTVRTTSRRTAEVEDIWLNPPDDEDDAHSRRILRLQLVDNEHSEEARVQVALLHQRRHRRNEPWEDVEAFNRARMCGGEEVRLPLDSRETLHLYRELRRWYDFVEDGIPRRNAEVALVDPTRDLVVQGREREVVEQLLTEAGEELWELLDELQPNLFRAVALAKLHQVRERAVAEFGRQLASNNWSEAEWQAFFEQNTWIFGYGLNYQFLSPVESQPDYGGRNVTGSGSQRGDFLMATEGAVRFTVLVEIKLPGQALLGPTYRNGAHLIGRHLAGGVAQLQANCRTWEREGSRQEDNVERLDNEGIHTYQPRGILVIGHSEQLDTRAKKSAFQLFRTNLHNPDVITFDELHARAKALLLNAQNQGAS